MANDIPARRRIHRVEVGGVGDAATLQGHPASYFATALPTVYTDTPPTPTAALRGVHVIVFDSTTGIDQEVTCLRNADGTYSWRFVSQGSSSSADAPF